MNYPILVERFDAKHPADMAVCEKCGHRQAYDPAEGPPEDVLTCDHCEAFAMTNLYDEGTACKGCGKLAYYEDMLPGPDEQSRCCSRRCALQAEYARTLGRTT